ncbi:hypothetical protein Emag_003733 [Eimeria magna]
MKLLGHRLALLAFLATEFCSGLTVKRGAGSGRVAVQLARESVAAAPGSTSRFVELSRASQGRARALNADCPEGCAFAEETSSLAKTKQERMRKQAKKLKKQAAKLRKQYLENHTEEEYELTKYQAIIQALEEDISGGNGGATAEGPE